MFYSLKMDNLDFNNMELKLQKEEVEIAIWINLNNINKIFNEKNINNKLIATGVDVNNKKIEIDYKYLIGIYPNNLNQGIGRAHTRIIKQFAKENMFDEIN